MSYGNSVAIVSLLRSGALREGKGQRWRLALRFQQIEHKVNHTKPVN